MKIDEIKLLYDYNDWADARILAACARVSPEQYCRSNELTGTTGEITIRAFMFAVTPMKISIDTSAADRTVGIVRILESICLDGRKLRFNRI